MSQSLEQGKRKLTAKDAITAGALGAVCIAIRFVFMLVGGVSPYVWFATHFMDAILIGPVFMLMVAKVRKNGPFLLTSRQGAKERPLSAHQPCHRRGAGSRHMDVPHHRAGGRTFV